VHRYLCIWNCIDGRVNKVKVKLKQLQWMTIGAQIKLLIVHSVNCIRSQTLRKPISRLPLPAPPTEPLENPLFPKWQTRVERLIDGAESNMNKLRTTIQVDWWKSNNFYPKVEDWMPFSWDFHREMLLNLLFSEWQLSSSLLLLIPIIRFRLK